MALVTLSEAKEYLRVDRDNEDVMISTLLTSACRLAADVARLTDEQWEAVDSWSDEMSGCTASELTHIRELMKTAVLYALGHMYEDRDQADYHELTLTLRSLLFSIRERVV